MSVTIVQGARSRVEIAGRNVAVSAGARSALAISRIGTQGVPGPASADLSGWANYQDTAGTQVIPANSRTLLTINGGSKDETQLPSDLGALWSGNRIVGRDGDERAIRLKMIATPSDGVASMMLIEFDIGAGSPIVIDEVRKDLLGGNGVAHKISFPLEMFCRATFAANGCAIYITADGPITLTAKAILVKRNIYGA